jgi:hypothetical protein
MGWIAESLGLDYLRVRDCRCKGRSHARIFDTEIGDEDASTSNWTKRREACMSALRRRFLQAGPEDSVQCLSIPKTLLRLW